MREPLTAPQRPGGGSRTRSRREAGREAGREARNEPGTEVVAASSRAMQRAARKGNRRRAWPRWAKPAMEAAGTLALLGAIGGGLFWAWKSGVFNAFTAELSSRVIDNTAAAGFALDQVFVEGRVATAAETVMKALNIARGDPLLTYDIDQARDRLEALPWVLTARVERHLPNALYVRMTEREPMAIWQHDGVFTVIDAEGRPLGDAVDLAARGDKTLEHLPQVVGPGAAERAGHLLDALSHVPVIERRVSSAVLVGERRWDLVLRNKMRVQLPEERMERALHQLAALEMGDGVFNRDIVSVDLRHADRMTLRRVEREVGPETPPPATPARKTTGKRT